MEHDGLLFLSLPLLRVLEILFLAESPAITNLLGKLDKAVFYLLIYLGTIVGFGVVMMVALLLHEYFQFKGLRFFFNLEGQFALHLVKGFVDAHELLQEVGARKDKVF